MKRVKGQKCHYILGLNSALKDLAFRKTFSVESFAINDQFSAQLKSVTEMQIR